ncbi:uncharacterized protein G2W53_037127 [Senna tora]|uniref:Uncharacterized protein n=1 Tax=Senna tora TaxID=362788 RepID=A0A834SUU1_9FABA|nr:uncharacterized protein G2W53_037127 [Senna tora]
MVLWRVHMMTLHGWNLIALSTKTADSDDTETEAAHPLQ